MRIPSIKSVLLNLLALLFIFLSYNEGKASHSMGADLTYQCLSNNQYRLKLKFYRDCVGDPADNTETIEIDGCGVSTSVTLNLVSATEVSQLCPGQQSTCNGGGLPGTEEYIYEGIVTLNTVCSNYQLFWYNCCRNGAITTLDNAASEDLALNITLNNQVAPCNNSPIFNNLPTPYVCAGENVNYSHGVTDPDGDQLVFALVNCENYWGSVDYAQGFSGTNPLDTYNGVNINPNTGLITFRPSYAQQAVLCVRVREYRNGVLIGETIRDMQFIVENCNNNPPIAGPFVQTGNRTYTACGAGQNFCLTINGSDPNNGDNITMNWNNGIPGGTFNVAGNNTASPTATFCWAPTTNQTGSYNFTVTVTDNACPQPAFNIYNYTINISNNVPNINLGANKGICPGETVQLKPAGTAHPAPGVTYSWSPTAGLYNPNAPTTNATPGSTTTYTLTATSALGCVKTDQVTVTVWPRPNFTITRELENCSSGSATLVTATSTGAGLAPYDFAWSTGTIKNNTTFSTTTVNPAVNTTYSVTITDSRGCERVKSYTALANPQLTLFLLPTDANCFNSDDGKITTNFSGGYGPFTYSWTGPGGPYSTANITGLGPGNYTLVVTNSQGCTVSASTTIDEPSNMPVTTTLIAGLDCFGDSDGVAEVKISGGTPPYNVIWDSGATTPIANNLTGGLHRVSVYDANGCRKIRTIDVTSPSNISATTTQTSPVDCFGGNNGAATVTVNGGTPGYTYSWDNGANSASTNSLNAGVHTVQITDANGCKRNKTVTITQPAQLNVVKEIHEQIICHGECSGRIRVIGNGGVAPYTYVWNTGSQARTISNLCAANYRVTITDANGCKKIRSLNIVEPTQLNVNANVISNVPCYAQSTGSATVSANGGTPPYSYLWDNGDATATTNSLNAGAHTVSVIDSRGCVVTDIITLTQPPSFPVNLFIENHVACYNQQSGVARIVANGGTPPYNFTWSNGENTAVASNLPAGTFRVTVTDANGCRRVRTSTITQPSNLIGTADEFAPTSCWGVSDGIGRANMSGGTPPYTYIWDTGNTNKTAANLSVGQHRVTITDANGCRKVRTATITEPPRVRVLTEIREDITCAGACDGRVRVYGADGLAPYTYLWDNGSIGRTRNNLCSGTVRVTVTDANGCERIRIYNLPDPPTLTTITSAISHVPCANQSTGTASIVANGGVAPYIYAWDNGVATATNSTLDPGMNYVTLTDANGCTKLDSVFINNATPFPVVLAIDSHVLCFNQSSGQAHVNASGGEAPYNYLWSNGETTSAATSLPAGIVRVTVTDSNGCRKVRSSTITQPAANFVGTAIEITPATCWGGSDGRGRADMTGGTPPYTYLWDTGSSTRNAFDLNAGLHRVSIYDANGCRKVRTVTITEPAQMRILTEFRNEITCAGACDGSVRVYVEDGITPYTYLWDDGHQGRKRSNICAGPVRITVTDANGCQRIRNYNFQDPPLFLTSMNVITDVLCLNTSTGRARVTPTGGVAPYTYLWEDGTVNATHNALPAGTHLVSITDANGCVKVDTALVNNAPAFPVAMVIDNHVQCFNQSNGAAHVTANGGTPPYTYIWSTGANTPAVTNLVGGVVRVTVTDANGCRRIRQETITEPTENFLGVAVEVTPATCWGASDGRGRADMTGGTPPYSYLWDTGRTNRAANNLNAGLHRVTIYDDNGCRRVRTVTITEPDRVRVLLEYKNEATCNGVCDGNIRVYGDSGVTPYTYLWSTGHNGRTRNNLCPGPINVTVTDANGCSRVRYFNIFETNGIVPSIVSNSPASCSSCTGTANLQVTGGFPPYNYLWSSGSTLQDPIDLCPLMNYVTITDANGCTTTAEVNIGNTGQGTISATVNLDKSVGCNNSNDGGATVTVNGGAGNYFFTWDNGEITASAITLSSGNHSVTIEDGGGCTTVATIMIPLVMVDHDNDGVCDVDDLDDDNDGIPDIMEYGCDEGTIFSIGCSMTDPNMDDDDDGILNYQDPDWADCGAINTNGICQSVDMDGDGIPNHMDLDADGDGIFDIEEAGGTDVNNDGEVDYPIAGDPTSMTDLDGDGLSDDLTIDTDGDGIPDASVDTDTNSSITETSLPVINTDGTGGPNFLDIDSDDDGLSDSLEDSLALNNGDTDGDGVPDYIDLDSDNDGINDIVEAGGVDLDEDALIDDPLDEASILIPTDSDGDGIPNYLEIDSNNDGITDISGTTNAALDMDGDGAIDNTYDPDGDGIPNIVDGQPNLHGDSERGVIGKIRLLLEGPFDLGTGLMSDYLNTNNLIPVTEPYTALGFDHLGGGGETVSPTVFDVTGPNAIVDWVFLELRDAADFYQVVATRSALLQADGDVVDFDGVSTVFFYGVADANYYVIARHRNHLSVMTPGSLPMNGSTSYLHDFTTGSAYGILSFGDVQKTVGPGKFGLYECDYNQDGEINAADRSTAWNTRNQTGYISEDSNFDGECNANERSQVWNNRNKVSRVPEN